MPSAETPREIYHHNTCFLQPLSGEENMVRAADDAAEKNHLVGAAGTVYATEASVDMESWPMNAVNIIFPTRTAEGTYTLYNSSRFILLIYLGRRYRQRSQGRRHRQRTHHRHLHSFCNGQGRHRVLHLRPRSRKRNAPIASVSITFPRFGEYDL